jgi:hypothetical protein
VIRRGGLAVAAAIALAGCGTGSRHAPPAAAGGSAQAVLPAHIPESGWPQFGYDAARSGSGPVETGIDAGDLRRLRRRAVRLPGTVDASAILLDGVRLDGRRRDAIFLTTAYGRTVAVDASSGRILWQFVPRSSAGLAGTYRITNATPTADPDRRYIYATSPDGYVRKLAVATGRQVWATRVTLYPRREKLASPPSIDGSALIVVTDGYDGDTPPYQGHVVELGLGSGRIEAVFNTLCSDIRHLLYPPSCRGSDSAIWGRAGAVVEPDGDVLISTGNGPFNGTTDWGDSVLELSSGLRLLHNFTPLDQAMLNRDDLDLGSTSPALLPDPGGPPLAVQGGKSGRLLLLDLDRLDGTGRPAGPRTGGQLQSIAAPGGAMLFAQPAVWVHGAHRFLFVADGSGTACYTLGPDRRLRAVWQDSIPGTSPVISGGLLYVYNQSGGSLVIRNPLRAAPLRTLAAAPGHWNSPIVAGGRIILPVGGSPGSEPTGAGMLYIYHLPGR